MSFKLGILFSTVSVLTLERALWFEIFQKMIVILLFWFAAQQQSSTCRRQKYGFFFSKFSVEFNELTPSF